MKSKFLAVSLLLLTLLTSCVVTQRFSMQNNALRFPGEAESEIHTSPFLVSVLEDLSCWTGSENQDVFMDVAVRSMAEGIAQSDFSRYVYINKDDKDAYQILFGFTDFNDMICQMAGDESQNIVSLKNENGVSKLSFCLSMDNYDTLTKVIPLLSDPNFEAYGPVYNNPPYDNRSEEDYLYMMEFIFGEEASIIADSTVKIVFDAPRPIISTTGTKLSETSTSFEFRLIDFLLLHNSIEFSCTY